MQRASSIQPVARLQQVAGSLFDILGPGSVDDVGCCIELDYDGHCARVREPLEPVESGPLGQVRPAPSGLVERRERPDKMALCGLDERLRIGIRLSTGLAGAQLSAQQQAPSGLGGLAQNQRFAQLVVAQATSAPSVSTALVEPTSHL